MRWLALWWWMASGVALAADPGEGLLGTWHLVLAPGEARQLEMYRLALGDPLPTEAELEAAAPSEEDLALLLQLLQWRQDDPKDPRLAKARELLEALGTATLEVTTRKMKYRLGKHTDRLKYVVTDTHDDEITLVLRRGGSTFPSAAHVDRDQLTISLPPDLPGGPPRVTRFRRAPEPTDAPAVRR